MHHKLCRAAVIVLICLVAGCNFNVHTDSLSAEDLTLEAVMTNDDCLDSKMKFWFSRFNQLQAEGFDMNDANEKAVVAVAERYHGCNGNQTNKKDVHWSFLK